MIRKIKLALIFVMLPVTAGVWGLVLYYLKRSEPVSSEMQEAPDASASPQLDLTPSDELTNIDTDVPIHEASGFLIIALIVVITLTAVSILIYRVRNSAKER